MNLRNLDLNQLVLLDALLAEKSVTRAANLVGLSQPTISITLSRLRRHFNDPILVRQGNAYSLTPLGTQLQPLTTSVLAGIDRVFSSANTFDAEASTREFSIVTSDYGATVFGPSIVRAIRAESPSSSVRFVNYDDSYINEPDSQLRFVDGMLMPSGVITHFSHTELFADDWVCVIDAENKAVGSQLTMADVERLAWVTTSGTLPTAPQRQLETLGFVPDTAVQVDSFSLVPTFVMGTDCIGIVQRRLAVRHPHIGKLRVMACPFAVPELIENFWWHPSNEHDPGHQWLRLKVGEASSDVVSAENTTT
ncbi:LysR family transcriptional regulator [Brevibacterium sp. FAM 24638]|uniref:LysR family transcriptional regulator n=1 Tax=Brevibacterium sp. FAM 24638 TaxID=3415681 RepID=UPI003C79F8F5